MAGGVGILKGIRESVTQSAREKDILSEMRTVIGITFARCAVYVIRDMWPVKHVAGRCTVMCVSGVARRQKPYQNCLGETARPGIKSARMFRQAPFARAGFSPALVRLAAQHNARLVSLADIEKRLAAPAHSRAR